jgi:hypothetical protein
VTYPQPARDEVSGEDGTKLGVERIGERIELAHEAVLDPVHQALANATVESITKRERERVCVCECMIDDRR